MWEFDPAIASGVCNYGSCRQTDVSPLLVGTSIYHPMSYPFINITRMSTSKKKTKINTIKLIKIQKKYL